jgi:D-lactate dehydrogenase
MKVLIYSAKDFEQAYLLGANTNNYVARMTEKALSPETAAMANGFDAVSVFTGDDVSAPVIEKLHEGGVRFIAIRAVGYDNTDLGKARELGIRVANVPEYSPYAIAEHALALILALNRKLIIADRQVHSQNFKVNNLVGFDLHGKTIGIIGTGKTGGTLVKILQGFDCRILGYDIHPNNDLVTKYKLEYTSLGQLCRESDIISIHTGLTPQTKYLVNKELIAQMKPGIMLINTGRGGCVNTEDVIHYLETGHIAFFGADVYEKERGLFFYDRSGQELKDETLKKLLAMPNVLITPHQAFATREALGNIADTTFNNIASWANNRPAANELFQIPFAMAIPHESH